MLWRRLLFSCLTVFIQRTIHVLSDCSLWIQKTAAHYQQRFWFTQNIGCQAFRLKTIWRGTNTIAFSAVLPARNFRVSPPAACGWCSPVALQLLFSSLLLSAQISATKRTDFQINTLDTFIEDLNSGYLQLALGYKTPNRFEQEHFEKQRMTLNLELDYQDALLELDYQDALIVICAKHFLSIWFWSQSVSEKSPSVG